MTCKEVMVMEDRISKGRGRGYDQQQPQYKFGI